MAAWPKCVLICVLIPESWNPGRREQTAFEEVIDLNADDPCNAKSGLEGLCCAGEPSRKHTKHGELHVDGKVGILDRWGISGEPVSQDMAGRDRSLLGT